MNVVDLFSLLQELDGNLRKSEQRVLNIVLCNPSSVSSMKSEELAKLAVVSLPTVTRFCREAGCKNFREFKLKLAQNVAIGDYYSQNAESGDQSDLLPMAESVANFAMNSIRKTFAELDYSSLDEAIEILFGARKICILGIGGASSVMSEMMMNRLFRLGFTVNVFHEEILAKMAAVTLTENDAAVAISGTGSSMGTVDFLRIAKENGVKTLSITRRDSLLSETSDCSLLSDSYEDGLVLKPATTRYSYMILIDLLAFGLACRNKDKSLALLKKQHTVVSHHKGNYTKDFLGD